MCLGRVTVDLYEEMASDMASIYEVEDQLACAVDLVEHLIQLGGDSGSRSIESDIRDDKYSVNVFDRNKHSLQKLRHYRYAILGWIAGLFTNDKLLMKVIKIFIISGRKMLHTSYLNDF